MRGESLVDKVKSSYALVQRNYNLVRRDAGWELVFIVYEVVNVLTIGFIGVNGPKETMNERVLYLVAERCSGDSSLPCSMRSPSRWPGNGGKVQSSTRLWLLSRGESTCSESACGGSSTGL